MDNTTQPTLSPEELQKQQERAQQIEVFNKKKQKVSDLLNSYKGQIAQALPKILTPDRMIRTALTAMLRKPELMDCTGHSLISCILTAAQLGLMPDDILGEAYLIPFNNTKKGVKECQLIPGYKGLCTLAMRSGQVKSISAVAVYDANKTGGDSFIYSLGLNEQLDHKPVGINDPAKISHFWAIVRFINGGHVFRVMTRAEVEKVRDESKNYKFAQNKANTVWGKSFEEMGCKTVVRRVLKYVPLSPEVARAIGLDEAAEMGKQNISIDFVDQMPEFTQDVDHEIITSAENENQEKQEEQQQQTLQQSANVTDTTLNAINEAATKATNQRSRPR